MATQQKRQWGYVVVSEKLGTELKKIKTVVCDAYEEAVQEAKNAESQGLHAKKVPGN